MRSRLMGVLMGLWLAAVMGCSTPAPASPEIPAHTAIAGAWREFTAALLAGEAGRATDVLFAEDAVSLGQDAPDCVGRAAIAETFREFLAHFELLALDHRTEELESMGVWAFERGTVTQTLQPDGSAAEIHPTRYFAIWKRQASGMWQVHRLVKY
jgi:ketosteroid isomerase-like protein